MRNGHLNIHDHDEMVLIIVLGRSYQNLSVRQAVSILVWALKMYMIKVKQDGDVDDGC